MKPTCEEIRGRIAAADGELDPDVAAHVRECAECAGVADARERVARALGARRGEPRAGFEARVTARALERIGARRRNAVVAGGAAAALAAGIVVFVMMRDAGPPGAAPAAGVDRGAPERPAGGAPVNEAEVVRELFVLSDVEGSLHMSARWDFVEDPIAETHLLAPELKGFWR